MNDHFAHLFYTDMFELDASLHTRLWQIIPPSRHAPNVGFVIATRGDLICFRLVNGLIMHVHYREIARHDPPTIMFSIAAVRRHLLHQGLFSIHQHIVSANILNMDEFFRRLDYLQFILSITKDT